MVIGFLLIIYGLLLSYLIGFHVWLLLQKKLKNDPILSWHPSLYPIIGLAAISLFLGVYHLFFKIDYIPHLFFLSWVLASYKQNLEVLKKLLQTNSVSLFFMVSLAAVLAVIGRPGTGDIADYHLQGIKWAEWFANIPGLGNFNRPLANNNWWFNVQAFLGFSWAGVQSVYVGNGIFFITVFFWFFRSEPSSRAHQWLRSMFLLFWVLSLKTAFIGAVTPDIVVTGTLFLLVDFSILLFVKPHLKSQGIWVMLLLVSWVLTVKATALSFGMLLLPFMIEWVKQKQWKRLSLSVIPVLIFMLPWLIGNVIISGYFLYPFHQLDFFSVDWKLPKEMLQWETFSIKNWGKISGQDVYITAQMSLMEWLPIWFSKLDVLNKLLVIGFVLCTPLIWLRVWSKKELLWPALFVISGFTLFFVNGPHPRFLFGYMVSTLGIFLYLFSDKISIEIPSIFWKGLLGVMLLFLLVKTSSDGSLKQGWLQPKSYPSINVTSIEIDWFKAFETREGSTCWDKWPCTYYMIPGTEMRGTEVAEGFRIKPNN